MEATSMYVFIFLNFFKNCIFSNGGDSTTGMLTLNVPSLIENSQFHSSPQGIGILAKDSTKNQIITLLGVAIRSSSFSNVYQGLKFAQSTNANSIVQILATTFDNCTMNAIHIVNNGSLAVSSELNQITITNHANSASAAVFIQVSKANSNTTIVNSSTSK